MSDIVEQKKKEHQASSTGNIILTASPFSNIGKQDGLNGPIDVPATAYRICNPSAHISASQYSSIGNSIIKSGIPKLSAHEVSDDVSICPVILHPTKQLSSQVQMKNDSLIKTIGFTPARSQIAMHQNRIVTSSLQRSIMESHQNVSPLIITPTPHVIHTTNEIVPAKIVPIPSQAPISHFSVINKTASYDHLPDYATIRPTMVSSTPMISGTPPLYTQSDFARFPKSYHHKSAHVNPAVIHGPISGYNEEQPCLAIPNSQHVFRPIISPRPSILRKRDVDGTQRNFIPTLSKTEIEDYQNVEDSALNRNGYGDSGGLQIESIMVPQIPEVVLPQISALTRQSHIMVEISPRKKPRKQLLPVNQDSPFKIVGDEMEYVDDKIIKHEKTEEYSDDVADCNDGDIEDEVDDDLDDNELLDGDDCPADEDDYDENDENDENDANDANDEEEDEDEDDFRNDYEDGFDYAKSDKAFYDDVKASADHSDGSSSFVKIKNKQPTLLGGMKNTWRGHSHHFQRYTDFKIKETKKQLAEMQQAKKWCSDSTSGWRVTHMLKQINELIKIEIDAIEDKKKLIDFLEKCPTLNSTERHDLIELVKDNIQRSKVTKDQLEDVTKQLNKIFEYKSLVEEVVDKYCPKEFKKKCLSAFHKI